MQQNSTSGSYSLNAGKLNRELQGSRLEPWTEALVAAVTARGDLLRHGHMPAWQTAVAALPPLDITVVRLQQAIVTIEAADTDTGRQIDRAARLRQALMALQPWRKGPFCIAGIQIDTEWRSDWKWDRIAPHMAPLNGRTVLDVGCGSGYHLWRMRGAGAATVLGIDPGLLFLMQFEALQGYITEPAVQMLPLTLESLPPAMHTFDTVFSMGVLYHRRDPQSHLLELQAALRPGGELILETLIAPGDHDTEIELEGRYARMRNIWCLPTCSRVLQWLTEAGFRTSRCVSVDVTTTDEQRTTEWMPSESLSSSLDRADPDLTIEGLPRPRRAFFIANVAEH